MHLFLLEIHTGITLALDFCIQLIELTISTKQNFHQIQQYQCVLKKKKVFNFIAVGQTKTSCQEIRIPINTSFQKQYFYFLCEKYDLIL